MNQMHMKLQLLLVIQRKIQYTYVRDLTNWRSCEVPNLSHIEVQCGTKFPECP